MIKKRAKKPLKILSATSYRTSDGKGVTAGTMGHGKGKFILLVVSANVDGLNFTHRKVPTVGSTIHTRGKIKAGLALSEESAKAMFLALGEELGFDMGSFFFLKK